jgi:hypothetical protein
LPQWLTNLAPHGPTLNQRLILEMTNPQILAVLGGAAGTLGSILTAFSLNGVIQELKIARHALDITTEALASPQRCVPVFTGVSGRIERAERRGSRILWFGVLLLAAGFILQAASVYFS